jgi:hypothetical protein
MPLWADSVGEVDLNLNGLDAGDMTPFAIHFDDAPTVYGRASPDGSLGASTREAMAGLSAVNPHTTLNESLLGTGLGPELEGCLVDPGAQQLIHMNSVADPARNPTFTFFGNTNFYFQSSGPPSPVVYTCDAWNHGDIQPEIARTFIGIVGPGVRNLGVAKPSDFFTTTWTPHVVVPARPRRRCTNMTAE